MQVDMSQIRDKYVGESEKNVKNIDVATVPIPSEYGDSYTFILRFENGEYVLTQE